MRPALVAEIAFAEWTAHGLLRQPRFEGLRTDKKPEDCRRERPKDAGGQVARAEDEVPRRRPRSRARRTAD